jgi:hypothetical protein
VSQSVTDLLATLDGLDDIANGLGAASIASHTSRSKQSLQLNGLHVVAFAAVEDFLRCRAYEVIFTLGKSGVKFNDFPDSFRAFVLEQTVEGVSFSLTRSEVGARINLLQRQGMLIGATSDVRSTFEPSEYFFGRTKSNISAAHIKSLLEAFVIEGGWAFLAQLATQMGQTHLGTPDQIFTRLSKNRHSAAHGFSNDYKVTELINDVRFGARVLSFAFDTCISQWAFQLKTTIAKNQIQGPFKNEMINLWSIEFEPTSGKHVERRNGKITKTIARRDVQARLSHHRAATQLQGYSVLKIDGQGKIDAWIQPIH